MPDFGWSHLTSFFLWAPGQNFVSLDFPILLPSTKPFLISLRQILKESFCSFLQLVEVWSKFLSCFNFVILVPKPLKVMNPMTAILGGYGNCDRMGSEVFEGLKNGAAALEGGAVGSAPRWMGNE